VYAVSANTTPDAAEDDVEAVGFEALLAASTLGSPAVERIRRRVPPEVCLQVRQRLAEPAQPVPDADTAVLALVRMCRTEGPSPYAGVLRLLVDRGALADVHPEVVEEIVAAVLAGAGKPPAVVVETCLAVIDKGRFGEDLASRLALLPAPGDQPSAPGTEPAPQPGQDAAGPRQVAEMPQRWERQPLPWLYPGGHIDFGGVVGPGSLAAWFGLLRLAILTVPVVLLAVFGFVAGLVVGLQPRPERWLGALACGAGTLVAGGLGLRWSLRRLARWRAHASPR
jgi:hypothetical protein